LRKYYRVAAESVLVEDWPFWEDRAPNAGCQLAIRDVLAFPKPRMDRPIPVSVYLPGTDTPLFVAGIIGVDGRSLHVGEFLGGQYWLSAPAGSRVVCDVHPTRAMELKLLWGDLSWVRRQNDLPPLTWDGSEQGLLDAIKATYMDLGLGLLFPDPANEA